MLAKIQMIHLSNPVVKWFVLLKKIKANVNQGEYFYPIYRY